MPTRDASLKESMNPLSPMSDFPLDLPSNWHHSHLAQTDSTMLRLRDETYAHCKEEFTLLTADYQTAGRGQRGTSWEADAGLNLLFGFLFHPTEVQANHQFYLSEALALAVCDALSSYADGFSVKWPNDIYWHDRKICGMLLEHDLQGTHIATTLTGVGINVNQSHFLSDAPNPVSLRQILGYEVEREALLAHLLQAFERYYRQLQHGNSALLHAVYMRHLYRREGMHPYEDAEGPFNARILDISSIGMLTLQRENGTQRTYAFKEVRFVNPLMEEYSI